jgi:hypothetical protein
VVPEIRWNPGERWQFSSVCSEVTAKDRLVHIDQARGPGHPPRLSKRGRRTGGQAPIADQPSRRAEIPGRLIKMSRSGFLLRPVGCLGHGGALPERVALDGCPGVAGAMPWLMAPRSGCL